MLAAFAELVEETKKTSDNLVEIKDYIFYEKKPVDEVRFSAQTSGNKEQYQSSNFANDQLKEVNGMRFSEVNGEKTYYYNTEK